MSRTELLAARPDLGPGWAALDAAFPVRVTRSFAARADLSNPRDPLAIQVVPDPRELDADPGDVADPVGDALRSTVPWVVEKHDDRLLLLLTKRCHVYCRYCFRRDHAPGGGGADPTAAELEAALAYVESRRPREVILSGGDPLILPVRTLRGVLDRLKPAVRTIRVHTRAPITFPDSVSEGMVDALRSASAWVVVHCNHPDELADDVTAALARLVDGGVPVLNQSVLLRGVNDDADVLAELNVRLLERRVHPYYLHVTDRVPGNAHLRVSLDEARELHRRMAAMAGGTALPRLVLDPPEGTGKVDVSPRAG